MKLSIVSTLYYSTPYLAEFHRRVSETARQISDDYEIIFVNDGSPDDSLLIALDLFERDEHVRVVDLSRNFGHHKAMMTGLMHVRGDQVFLIDCDLEESPELLLTFHEKMRETQADVIFGVQSERKGSLLKRILGDFFYRLNNFFSAQHLPRNLLTVRLMSRRYIDQLVRHQENVFFIAGLWQNTGYKQVPVMVDKADKGRSTYNFWRKLAIIYAITSFSNRPLLYIAYLGILLTVPAAILIIHFIWRYLAWGIPVDGWTSMFVSVWFFGGLNIFVLGVIAIYISVIFAEVKRRPYTIVRDVYQRLAEDAPAPHYNVTASSPIHEYSQSEPT